MDNTIPRERLAEIFDQVVREITQREAGICLATGEAVPDGELFTVYTVFERGYSTCLSLCAESALFTRLTQGMMHRQDVSPRDVEDFAKEYFNVLCGHIVAQLYRETKIPARFSPPSFRAGRYIPEDHLRHIVLTYAGDRNEHVQLIHLAPRPAQPEQPNSN
jgi:hypothetical protein